MTGCGHPTNDKSGVCASCRIDKKIEEGEEMAKKPGFKKCPKCGKNASSNAQPKCACGHVWYSRKANEKTGQTEYVKGNAAIRYTGMVDPEIDLLARLVAELRSLDEPACSRILAYLCERFTCSSAPDFKLDKS